MNSIQNTQEQQHSVEQLIALQNEILSKIKGSEEQLASIRRSNRVITGKWQQLLQIILPIQLETIKNHFGDDQLALSRFNEELLRESASQPQLLELNKCKWLFIYEKAFGVTEFKDVSLEEAQSLIANISEEMISALFLKQIDQTISALPPDASLVQKRQALLTILFPLHLSVMGKHGFEGEIGYVQAQRAIMDYYSDPEIARLSAHAQAVVFKRAGLI